MLAKCSHGFGLGDRRRSKLSVVSSAIWRQTVDGWQVLAAAGFASEEELHDLVEAAPHLLPLSGSPSLTVVGREVALGSGWADLVAVEPDGRLTIIEIKLHRNAEARRAIVAQVLMYAAFLKGMDADVLERDVLRGYLTRLGVRSLADAVEQSDQSGVFEREAFTAGLAESLDAGAFRLVLVLDSAPAGLVQMFGYLEDISSGVMLDLVTVATYQVGDESILVPHRIDPAFQAEVPEPAVRGAAKRSSQQRDIEGSDAFEQSIEHAGESDQPALRQMLEWARLLEQAGVATLRTQLGEGREILKVWVHGETAGLASIWNDRGAYLSLWRTALIRLAWRHVPDLERLTSQRIGQGSTERNPSHELLDRLADAYRTAAQGVPPWNKRDFYFAFGDGPRRDWDDAREYGFVGAGGGEWYSRSLRQLKPGHRVLVYIPSGTALAGTLESAKSRPRRCWRGTSPSNVKASDFPISTLPELLRPGRTPTSPSSQSGSCRSPGRRR